MPVTPQHGPALLIAMTTADSTAQPHAAHQNRVHTEEVTGSIPVSPTSKSPGQRLL